VNIILCGLPMCGKTTVGKLVASTLKFSFVDVDDLIEKAYAEEFGKKYSCRQIYFLEGEPTFREFEQRQIASLDQLKSCVISVGGGALDRPANVDALKRTGKLIYLKAAPSFIWKRMLATRMPAYLNAKHPAQDFMQLVEKRVPLYEAASDIQINIDELDPTQITALVVEVVKGL
jgi:shikimate kinase